MRELRKIGEAEHAGKPFQGMDAAENGVNQLRVALLGFGIITEADQIETQLIDDLLGLRQKILYRFTHIVVGIGHQNLCKSVEGFRLRYDRNMFCLFLEPSVCSLPLSNIPYNQFVQLQRIKRFCQVFIRAERQTLFHVSFTAFG